MILVGLQLLSPHRSTERVHSPELMTVPESIDGKYLYRSVVIDAGSSGTRLYAFGFASEDLVDVKQLFSLRLKPGLSACYNREASTEPPRSNATSGTAPHRGSSGETQEAADDEFARACAYNQTKKLLVSLLAADCGFDRGAVSSVPVYVRATAGLRLLSTPRQVVLLRAAEQAVADAHFADAEYEAQRPRVIAGTEEALYDWLAVNVAELGLDAVQASLRHANNRGGQAQVDSTDVGTAALSPLLGVMDLGGASTQIAYHVPVVQSTGTDDNSRACEVLHYLRGLGKLRLYAVSRLGFGHNEMFATMERRFQARAKKQPRNHDDDTAAHPQPVPNPCLFRGTPQDGAGDFEQCRRLLLTWLDNFDTTNSSGSSETGGGKASGRAAWALDDSTQASPPPCMRTKVPSSEGLRFVGLDHFVKIARLLFPTSQQQQQQQQIDGQGSDATRVRRQQDGSSSSRSAAEVPANATIIRPSLDDLARNGRQLCAMAWPDVQHRNSLLVARGGAPPMAANDLHKACFLATCVLVSRSCALIENQYGHSASVRVVQVDWLRVANHQLGVLHGPCAFFRCVRTLWSTHVRPNVPYLRTHVYVRAYVRAYHGTTLEYGRTMVRTS